MYESTNIVSIVYAITELPAQYLTFHCKITFKEMTNFINMFSSSRFGSVGVISMSLVLILALKLGGGGGQLFPRSSFCHCLDRTSFPFTCITPCYLVALFSLVKYFQPKTSLLCHLSVCKSSPSGRQLFPHFPRLHNAQHTVLETAEPIHADNARMLGLDSSASHQWHMVHSQRRLSSLQPFSTPTTAFSL